MIFRRCCEPDAAGAKALAAKCLERGLLILTCRVYSDTVRLLCPLSAPDEIVNEGLDILEKAVLGNQALLHIAPRNEAGYLTVFSSIVKW